MKALFKKVYVGVMRLAGDKGCRACSWGGDGFFVVKGAGCGGCLFTVLGFFGLGEFTWLKSMGDTYFS